MSDLMRGIEKCTYGGKADYPWEVSMLIFGLCKFRKFYPGKYLDLDKGTVKTKLLKIDNRITSLFTC